MHIVLTSRRMAFYVVGDRFRLRAAESTIIGSHLALSPDVCFFSSEYTKHTSCILCVKHVDRAEYLTDTYVTLSVRDHRASISWISSFLLYSVARSTPMHQPYCLGSRKSPHHSVLEELLLCAVHHFNFIRHLIFVCVYVTRVTSPYCGEVPPVPERHSRHAYCGLLLRVPVWIPKTHFVYTMRFICILYQINDWYLLSFSVSST